jgi:hypothetical protein
VNHCELHNGAKSLIIIDTGTLRDPTKNSSSLVPLECPIGLELVLEHPLAGDNIGAPGVRNQVPSAIGHESGVLFPHSRSPMGISEGGLNGLQEG